MIEEQERKKAYDEFQKEQEMIKKFGKEEFMKIKANERKQAMERQRVIQEQQQHALELQKKAETERILKEEQKRKEQMQEQLRLQKIEEERIKEQR
jgi:DNA-binding helix-hairpin-helix protein with protein kinase domain